MCDFSAPLRKKACGLAKTEENDEQNIVAMMKDDGSRKIQRCRTAKRIAEHRIGKDLLTTLKRIKNGNLDLPMKISQQHLTIHPQQFLM